MKKVIERISVFVVASAFLLGVLTVGNTDMNKNVLTSTTINGIDIESLDNKKIGWGIKRNDNNEQPDVGTVNRKILDKYQGIYMGNKEQKLIYLTFDLGYEAGYTSKILEVLKKNDVKATFFITAHYLNTQPDLVKQMIDEGHIVANHTNHHYSMPSVTYSTDVFNKELTDVEDKFKELTGKDMPKFFRPPMGQYSQKSLAMTKDLGYKTVFWSFAYGDYEPSNQPSLYEGKKNILDHLHDGSILLLHAISKTNADILGEVIDEARKSGYEFYLLP